jgi:hypothetical protein
MLVITSTRQVSPAHYNSNMAEVVESQPRLLRREVSRQRRRKGDLWIAITALFAAMLALPLAQSSWHGPEVAAVLAVAATSLLAGQRWAVAVIVIAELLMLPTVWPRAFLASGDMSVRIAALLSLIALVPGMLAMRRGAAALVLVTGRRRTQKTCRRFHMVLVAIGLIATMLPLV